MAIMSKDPAAQIESLGTDGKPVPRRRLKYYFSLGLALLTCPCHVPILIFVLSGTAASVFLAQNLLLAVAIMLPFFLISVVFTMHFYRGKGYKD